MTDFRISAFFHFAPLDDYTAMREPLLAVAREAGIRGSILLAGEGVNGTIAGTQAGVERVLAHLRADPRLAGLVEKASFAGRMPFGRLKVRLKKEIVSLGVAGIDPRKAVGTYVAPADWNALISDPDVVVLDTRNDYEIAFGSFEGAISPDTRTFRSFPDWVRKARADGDGRKVAMFCTGGIRCEKASALLLSEGFGEVFHLEGGILNYLEKVPEAESLWQGACFVFDERVAVDHALRPTWGRGAPEAAREVLPAGLTDELAEGGLAGADAGARPDPEE
ncbi:rhodanese-related sulfurtransferase [Stappia sp.]|uniref:oxygen-dependent tRNA uridine(34) hydroxylase TrhO n=1 Tax=Stappia sp. TaxID=1870903 RepID=UPI003D125896